MHIHNGINNLGLVGVLATSVFLCSCNTIQPCDKTIVVTESADSGGRCRRGDCTLRAAIFLANQCEGPNTIELGARVHTIGKPDANVNAPENGNYTGDFDVTEDLTIRGVGLPVIVVNKSAGKRALEDVNLPRSIIDGQTIDRIFDVHEPARLVLERLTLENGETHGDPVLDKNGGAIRVREGASLVANEVVIRNSKVGEGIWSGGGIYNQGSLTLVDVEFNGNRSNRFGGGLANLKSRAKLINVRFIANKSWTGGGVYSSGSVQRDDERVTIQGGLFSNNEALHSYSGYPSQFGPGSGGGISIQGNFLIEDVEVSSNIADESAGGIGVADPSIGIIRNSEVRLNRAPRGGGLSNRGWTQIYHSGFSGNNATDGGGIIASGTTEIFETVVDGNTATETSEDPNNIYGGHGGGVYVDGVTAIEKSTLSNNAGKTGGGLYVIAGVATLKNVTISGNSAGEKGGGVFVESVSLYVKNTTITNNSAPDGSGLYNSWHPLGPAWTRIGHSIVGGNTGGGNQCVDPRLLNNQGGPSILTLGSNISSDQSCALVDPTDRENTDPMLGPLALNDTDNSGTTQTHLPSDGSPAIDGGATTTSIFVESASCLIDDQRLVMRPQNSVCDIGAVEVK